MSKVKSVSQFDGSTWGEAVPLGADADNVDITSTTTAPSDTTATLASLDTADVTVLSTNSDTGASAWTKFNRFRKRVANNFANYIAGSITTSYTSTGSNTTVYPTLLINNYMSNVIGYTGTTQPSAGSVSSQLLDLQRNTTITSYSLSVVPGDVLNVTSVRASVWIQGDLSTSSSGTPSARTVILYCTFIWAYKSQSVTFSSSGTPLARIKSSAYHCSIHPIDDTPLDIMVFGRANDYSSAHLAYPCLLQSSTSGALEVVPVFSITLDSAGTGNLLQVKSHFALPVEVVMP